MTTNIEDRLDSTAEGWKPEPGDKIWGEIVELGTREGDFGPYPTITILTDEGRELVFHAFHTVARNELAAQNPQLGDTIGVKYIGKMKSRAGREFENYKVIVQKIEVNWTPVAEAAQAELGGVTDDPEAGVEPEQIPGTEKPARSKKRVVTGPTDDIPF